MITLLGKDKVYTVPEVRFLVANAKYFEIVDTLPSVTIAKDNWVYWLRTGKTYQDKNGNVRPVVMPYIKGHDSKSNAPVWYTTGESIYSYDDLNNLPSINGEVFINNMDEAKARAAVSSDGMSGGYDLSIHDDDIIATVKEAMD